MATTAKKASSNPGGTNAVSHLRIASYNVRVDHSQDLSTIHDWPLRRNLVVSSLRALRADLIGIQEPSPPQGQHMQKDLGDRYGVHVSACNPDLWESLKPEEPIGQARDGNGEAEAASDASEYARTATLGRFRVRASGAIVAAISAHFDHQGVEAKKQSARICMAIAKDMALSANCVVFMGDVNTFTDKGDPCYTALAAAAGAGANLFGEVRDLATLEVDCGRGSESWEGWETNAWSRSQKGKGKGQRYDQMFVTKSAAVQVLRTAVVEELFRVSFKGKTHSVYASDHLPIVCDLSVTSKTLA